MKNIKLGYEIGTADIIEIKPSHLIVTGVTQLSGKTTTLEALIKRSGLKTVVFKTKIGEKSFTEGTEVPPFFRDRSDYEFVKSLIEAYAKEKLFLEKGALMQLCKGSSSLLDIKQRVDEKLAEGLRGLKEEIYIRLQHYLENLIPQIQYANLSKTLNIYEGVNIMNLERFSEEAQSLIIQAVADEVLKTMKDTIIVIPEAWKFMPQKYNNPCKRVVESFIRQGATNNNFIWVDSQDMAGVDKSPLKQISTWVLGYQSEINEVKHTLDQMPLPAKAKPKTDEIMMLQKGHFFLASYDGLKKVYVQPAWLDDDTAILVAKGEIKVEEISKPDNLVPFAQILPQEKSSIPSFSGHEVKELNKELIELRNDFFNKIQEIQNGLNKVYSELFILKSAKAEINVDEIVSKVLQKVNINGSNVNEDAIVQKVLVLIPKQSGSITYEVAPLEKIKKDFLEEAKNKILSDVEKLSDDAKRSLKYIESVSRLVSTNEVVVNGFMLKSGGGNNQKVLDSLNELGSFELVVRQSNGKTAPNLRKRISFLTSNFEVTEQEIEQVYNHVLMETLKEEMTNG